ncbi:hypothetical protein [Neptunicella sp. SCSIO 80796]|uniref:hypothetical protein n=1 Tax=Neptunicella plasticusilytica TaxID=3117012 RepID=UPI003A4DEBA5
MRQGSWLNIFAMSKTVYSQWFRFSWHVVALLIIFGLGLSHLYYPLGPDQATILYGAKALDHGATLYIEYWDNKQPGLYYFYYFAGQLFGFNEFGIHLLELIWLVFFATILVITLRSYFQHKWLAPIVPVATIAVYYAVVGVDELTQLEMIAGLPIYLSMWFALRAIRNPHKLMLPLVMSGVFAGIAVLFKLLLGAIVMLIWGIALVYLLKHKTNHALLLATKAVLALLSGTAIPLVFTLGYFWSQEGLYPLLWTAFIYPGQALVQSPAASLSRLITAAGFYLSYYGPWLIFVVIAVYKWGRNRFDVLTSMLIGWLCMALILFIVQRFSWWHYHALLLFVPTGILAVLGIGHVINYLHSQLPESRVKMEILAGLVILLPLLAALAPAFIYKSQQLLSYLWIRNGGIQQYQSKISPHYQALRQSAEFLRHKEAKSGPIYVFGNAMIYAFAERQCAYTMTGSAWEFYLPEQIGDILDNLAEKNVPYIFVGKNDYKIYSMNIAVKIFLNSRYKVLKTDVGGTWYRLTDDID